MAKSRDPSELQYYWEQFREASGKKIRANYVEHVDLLNEAAKLNGFRDASKMKVDVYESDTFMEEMEATWEGLKPLYSQLHAYVRNKLLERYGREVVSATGALPAHLLGNMWAQSWNNIADMLTPYPAKPSIDVTEAMVRWVASLPVLMSSSLLYSSLPVLMSSNSVRAGPRRRCSRRRRISSSPSVSSRCRRHSGRKVSSRNRLTAGTKALEGAGWLIETNPLSGTLPVNWLVCCQRLDKSLTSLLSGT